MRVPLIEDLLKAPLQPGKSILVEYDPTSAWYQGSITMAAGWLKEGGVVTYNVASQPPDNIRLQLAQLGLNVTQLEESDIQRKVCILFIEGCRPQRTHREIHDGYRGCDRVLASHPVP
jgi:hypothetical protein